MKKTNLLILIIFLMYDFAYSQQSIFYVAKDLKEQINPVTGTILLLPGVEEELEENVYKGITVTTAILNTNPFLKDLFEDAPGSSSSSPFISTAVNSIGGLNVTKYANAIADIMIERAKQELSIAFFDRFKKFAADNPEFQILFPKTTENLGNLLTYTYPQMLPALRNGFFEDLKQLTYHLDDVLELPRYRYLLNNFAEVRVAIKSIRLIHGLETGNATAADVIKDFADFDEWKLNGSTGFKNMSSTIKLAALFSESLRYKDSSRIWVSSTDAEELVQDKVFANLYMGLLYQQIKNAGIKYYTNPNDTSVTKNLADILAELKNNIFLFQNKVAEFTNITDKVLSAYMEIKIRQKELAKIADENIYNYINVSVDAVDYAFSFVKIFDESLVTDKYLDLAKKSNSLYKDIYSQQYTQAVNDATDILLQVHNLAKENKEIPVTAVPANALAAQPALDKFISFIEDVKPYALFMANMVEAKDEKEIKAALENVILPVGSSSIKKHTGGNISVQTYLGAYLSVSNKNKGLTNSSWSDKFGVIAPIGLSWTPGCFSWQKKGSLSFFASVFDLGAIVDYNLKEEPDPTNTDPDATIIKKDYEVKLGQIFSPGVYAVYGFFNNIPLSLGFGSQYGPGLSKIDAANNAVVNNPSWRWNFFLAVDMPFFTLKNKVKYK